MWKFPHYEIGQPVPWRKLESEFKWFRDMKGVPQDPEWHAEGDVFIHTKMVVDALLKHPDFQKLSDQDKHILFAVAMLHDVEKRSTTETEEVEGILRVTSRGHAKKGEKTARSILYKDIPTPFFIREHICKLVRHHGLPIWAIEKENPEFEVVSASVKLDTNMLTLFAEADILGRIADDASEMMLRVNLFKELCQENNCFGEPRKFETSLAQRTYFQKRGESYINYVPHGTRKDFTAYLMCALPGSGKDTYIKEFMPDTPVVSLDDLRRERKVKRGDTKGEGHVIQDAKELAKVYMRKEQDFIWNATNITSDLRTKLVSEFEDYGGNVEIIYIEAPYRDLLVQNSGRKHKVPEKAIDKMIKSLDVPDVTESYSLVIHQTKTETV